MTRLAAFVAILATLNVCSALTVVYMKHLSRLSYIEISDYQATADELDVEWSQLQIEESTFSEHGLIEQIAVKRLEMVFPDLSETVMITR